MAQAFIGVGSNIDKEENIRAGVHAMQNKFSNVKVSCIYESCAVGFKGDNYFNLVVGLETEMTPCELQEKLHEIENQFGRKRAGSRFISRTLDLDLLLYDDLVCDEVDMKIPREDVTGFAFVLRPLSEIAGNLKHPILAERYVDLWEAFEQTDQEMWPVEFEF
jgi:2-amino-4-hydroxy-6-hydroxymethyldihydropteridine diphosphokinase